MSDSEQIVLTPILPGWLTLIEIAELAQIGVNTIRGYNARDKAGFPPASSRSGTTPLWTVDEIVEWLQSRPLSPTQIEVRPDGTLVVTRPSDYKERKAAGNLTTKDSAAEAS